MGGVHIRCTRPYLRFGFWLLVFVYSRTIATTTALFEIWFLVIGIFRLNSPI